MTGTEKWAAAGTALLVCRDNEARELIIQTLQMLAIRSEVCEDVFTAVKLLDKRKFEAVIVDFLIGDEAEMAMEQIRFSRTNRTAVTFAITAGNTPETSMARQSSTFVLKRPLTTASVAQILKAAYGLIVRERRRYFRCPMTVPAFVRSGEADEFLCETVNISEGGLAISTRTVTPEPKLPAVVRFSLPGHESAILADARVCWRGESGLVGLEFRALDAPQKSELQEWLACRLDDALPESVAALFRSAGQP